MSFPENPWTDDAEREFREPMTCPCEKRTAELQEIDDNAYLLPCCDLYFCDECVADAKTCDTCDALVCNDHDIRHLWLGAEGRVRETTACPDHGLLPSLPCGCSEIHGNWHGVSCKAECEKCHTPLANSSVFVVARQRSDDADVYDADVQCLRCYYTLGEIAIKPAR